MIRHNATYRRVLVIIIFFLLLAQVYVDVSVCDRTRSKEILVHAITTVSVSVANDQNTETEITITQRPPPASVTTGTVSVYDGQNTETEVTVTQRPPPASVTTGTVSVYDGQNTETSVSVTQGSGVVVHHKEVRTCNIGTVGYRLAGHTENNFCTGLGPMVSGNCNRVNYCPSDLPYTYRYTQHTLGAVDEERDAEDILVLALEEYSYTSPQPWGNATKSKNQMWSVFGAESLNYLVKPYGKFDLSRDFLRPVKKDPRIDVSIGYSSTLFDLQAGYYPDSPNEIMEPPFPVNKKTGLISSFISNGVDYPPCNRQSYITELMKHMRVDNLGKWKNNLKWKKPLSKTGTVNDVITDKMHILKHYKFTLAFENTEDKDMITEKFWQPLRTGTVPVYLGAPNIGELFPVPHSFINAKAYTPQQLAVYLNYLDKNDTAYGEFFAWKNKPLPQAVLDLTRKAFTFTGCRLCEYFYQRFN